MTVTRLRSDKGSFVQSPLGAFDSEAAVGPTPSGSIVSITGNAARSWAVNSATCAQAETALGTTGYNIFRINYFSTLLPTSELVNWYHIGSISGTVWRPADDVAFVCELANEGAWGSANNVNVGGDFVVYQNLYRPINSSTVPSFADYFANYGEFPGTVLPPFQVENLLFSLTPP